MPIKPGMIGDAAVEADFVQDSFGVPTGPAITAVRAQSRNQSVERNYRNLPRMWKIVYVAKQGALAGKPWFASAGGELYPDGVDPEDPKTWLQPGESMIVERDVMLAIAGDIMNPNLPDKQDIILKYGGWEYDVQPTQDAKVSGKIPVMTIIGPPPAMPDITIEPLGMRGPAKLNRRSLIDTYCKGQQYAAPQMISDKDGHEVRRKDTIAV